MTTTPIAASADTRPTGTPSRLPALTGLRFVAALAVFLFHAHWLAPFSDPGVQSAYDLVTRNGGAIGVSFFFVLSGFILTWSARPGDSLRGFYRRRFFKIAPNHVVAYTFALVMMIAGGAVLHWGPVIANFFLVHSWLPYDTFALNAVSGVTWSLSVELAFYLCFPFLLVLVRRIAPANLWKWAIGLSVLVAVLPILAQPFVSNVPWYPYFPEISWDEMWLLYFNPIARFPEFMIGMVVARAIQTGRWPGVGIMPAALATIAVYVVSLFLPFVWTWSALYPLPLVLLVGALATADTSGRQTFFASKPMVFLGEISYALFLIHFTLLYALHGALASTITGEGGHGTYEGLSWGPLGATLFLVGTLAASIAVATVMYLTVERPIMRRWARPKPKARADL